MHEKAIQVADSGDACAYISADLEWHQAVWEATGNHCLAESLKRIALPLFGFSAIAVATRAGFDLRQDAMSHAPLLAALNAHDPDAAAAAFDQFVPVWESQWLDASLSSISNEASSRPVFPYSRIRGFDSLTGS